MAYRNPLAYTGRVAASTKVQGDAEFNNDQFSVVNGTVQLKGAGLAVDTLAGDTGTAAPTATGVITVAGGTGLTSVATGNTVTVNGDDATISTKGIASFPTAQFSVTAGAVTILNASTTVKGAATFNVTDFTVTAGDVAINQATITTTGVASFPTAQFSVAAGAVTLLDASTTVKGGASFNVDDFTVTAGNVVLNEALPSVATVTLTSAQVLLLATTPITLVAAPAAGKAIIFMGGSLKLTYGGSNVFTEAADDLGIKYTDAGGVQVSDTIETTGFIDQSANTYTSAIPAKDAIVAASAAEAQALVLDNLNANFGGNAGGDNTLIVNVMYRIIEI